MPATSAGTDYEILLADGTTWLPLIEAPPTRRNYSSGGGLPTDVVDGAPKIAQDTLTPRDADQTFADELQPIVMEDWSRGIGLDYHSAECLYARTPGYVIPAGWAVAVAVPGGGTATPLVTFTEYNGDLYVLEEGNDTSGGRVLVSAGGTGVLSVSLSLGAHHIGRDLIVFDDGSGNSCLYVSFTDASGLNGQLRRLSGAVWAAASGAVFTGARGKMAKVFWRGADGVGYWRLITISGSYTIAYTIPNADPYLAASWVEGVKIAASTPLNALVAARTHVWIRSNDNIYDLTADGDTPALTSYTERAPEAGIPFPIMYSDDYLYNSTGPTIDRVYVGGGNVIQEDIGQCSPGWATRAESEWTGFYTAFTKDQGWLCAAQYNPITGRSGVFWGKDRKVLNVDTPNPLVWHGPEITTIAGYRITAMWVTTTSSARFMWVALLTTASSVPVLATISLPLAGAPIQDLVAGGNHRFTDGLGAASPIASAYQRLCQLRLMDETWKDKGSLKIVNFHTFGSRGLDNTDGTKLTVYTRADPLPGSTAWGTGHDITGSPTEDYTPATVTQGHKIERRVDFVSPDGIADTNRRVAVLDSIRTVAWVIQPDSNVRLLDVIYGDNALGLTNNQPLADYDPDDVTAALVALTRSGRTTLRDRDDKRWTVKLSQTLDRETQWGTGGRWDRQVKATLRIVFLAAAA